MALQLNVNKGNEKSSTDESLTAIPMFLWKLVHLLKEPASQPYISWNEDGSSFTVHDQSNFSKIVLPKYFKHNKFSSFVRQLNIYGFRKAVSIQQGVLKDAPEAVEFYHPYFREDNMEMLQLIKRKVHTVIPKPTPDEIDQVLHDVHEVKDSQKKISGSLAELKQENESLWREVVSLRQKHSQQQKVVNHLIKFLVSIVQHHGMGTKRRYPLMIDEGSSSSSPSKKMSRQSSQIMFEPVVSTPSPAIVINQPQEKPSPAEGPLITELLSTSSSPAAPQKLDKDILLTPNQDADAFDISDLMQLSEIPGQQAPGSSTNELTSQQMENTNLFVPISSPSNITTEVIEPSAYLNLAPTSKSNLQLSREGTSPRQSPTVTVASTVAIPSVSTEQNGTIDNLNLNMDKITNNLQSIKDRLSSNDQIHLEYDMLQELFNGSADLSPTPNLFDYSSLPLSVPQHEGNELVQYSRDNLLPSSNIIDESDLDYNEILDSLKD